MTSMKTTELDVGEMSIRITHPTHTGSGAAGAAQLMGLSDWSDAQLRYMGNLLVPSNDVVLTSGQFDLLVAIDGEVETRRNPGFVPGYLRATPADTT